MPYARHNTGNDNLIFLPLRSLSVLRQVSLILSHLRSQPAMAHFFISYSVYHLEGDFFLLH